MKTKSHKDGQEKTLNGKLDLPPDVYNGMLITVAKNISKGTSKTVHFVGFTPTPRIIELELQPAGKDKIVIGELAKNATRYVLKPKLGTWLMLFAKLLGRVPPESRAWIISDEPPPAFVRFEGPLYTMGPIWRIETTTPRWPG